ncbi:hypothetical protein IF1G_11032 [Cordyceps javanica]|uniref:Uncharacterized protein n=1 Tax=Cordyceps javanica TaxID=43265 RepID=A0A545VJ28_9HYPO|nr:hypothetical protein IF1G_11032 [Cordyceps javanica]TQW01731.1 hypothetical protein IF2G_10713 [Cordyceps javanica]
MAATPFLTFCEPSSSFPGVPGVPGASGVQVTQGGFLDPREQKWYLSAATLPAASQPPYSSAGFASSQDGRGPYAPNPPTGPAFTDHRPEYNLFEPASSAGPTYDFYSTNLGRPPSQLGGEFGRSHPDVGGLDQNDKVKDLEGAQHGADTKIRQLEDKLRQMEDKLRQMEEDNRKYGELLCRACEAFGKPQGSNSDTKKLFETLEAKIDDFLGQPKATEGSDHAN